MAHEPVSPVTQAAFQAAVAAHRQGRLGEARAGYEAVLRADGGHADALHLLGMIHLQQGALPDAERFIRRALAIGERPAFWANLGNILKDTGRGADAQVAYQRALAMEPAFAEVWNNLAMLQADAGDLEQAEASYRRALAAKPGYAAAAHNLALLLHQEGSSLLEAGRLPQAEATLRRLLALDGANARALVDLGLALHRLGRDDEALAAYANALALDPELSQAHYNRGAVLDGRRQWADAEAAYRRAIELNPAMPGPRYNLGILLLRQSRFEEGWRQYEARYDTKLKPAVVLMPQLSIPQWRGEPLAGRSLVIWPEQGFGDYIQFARYAPRLKEKGVSRLTCVSYPALAELLASIDGVDEVVTEPLKLRRHDHWAFPLSLPLHCSAAAGTIPAGASPYVHAPAQRVARWRGRLPASRPRVGLVWRGSAGHKNDANRSLPLASLAPLWSVPGLSFISLQKGQGEEEAAAPPAGQPLTALGGEMADFTDAAAIVSELDLVICVDTAIAHLAGAMGKPCWVLLPSVKTDWRWGLEGDVTPWYPTLRLFRQAGPGWDATIAQVADALRGWAAQAAA